MDHRCGDTRGCFVNCEGNDCQYVVSWHYRPEYVDFSITRKVTGGGSKWLAIGFSSDPKMGDDDVLHCLSDSAGHVTVARSYNQGTSNQPIANVRVTNVQGRVLCTLEVFMIYYFLIYHKLPFNLNNYDSGIKQCQFEFSTYLFLICIVKICKVINGTKC